MVCPNLCPVCGIGNIIWSDGGIMCSNTDCSNRPQSPMSAVNDDIDSLQAGKGLDALVARRVMKWKLCEPPHFYEEPVWVNLDAPPMETVQYVDSWSPSTNIADAWEVLGHFDTFDVQRMITGPSTFRFDASVTKYDPEQFGEARADDAPLAICRAALKATESP